MRIITFIAGTALTTALSSRIAFAYTFADLADDIVGLINGAVVPILFSAALAAFIYGIGRTILKGDSPEEQRKGRSMMIYGLISLFVVVSLWSIINIVQCTFFGRTCFYIFF